MAPTRIVTTKVTAPHSRRSPFTPRPSHHWQRRRFGTPDGRGRDACSWPASRRASPRRAARRRTPHPDLFGLEHARDCVGELDLAQCPRGGLTERRKDGGAEHISAHHGKFALGLSCRRLLDNTTHTVQLATRLGDLGTPVPGNLVLGHAHQSKDGRPELLVRVPELPEHRRIRQRQIVGEHAQKGPLPHGSCRAEHRVAEAAGRRLAGNRHPAQVPRVAYGLELDSLAAIFEQALQSGIGTQVGGQRLLAFGEDEDQLIGP